MKMRGGRDEHWQEDAVLLLSDQGLKLVQLVREMPALHDQQSLRLATGIHATAVLEHQVLKVKGEGKGEVACGKSSVTSQPRRDRWIGGRAPESPHDC